MAPELSSLLITTVLRCSVTGNGSRLLATAKLAAFRLQLDRSQSTIAVPAAAVTGQANANHVSASAASPSSGGGCPFHRGARSAGVSVPLTNTAARAIRPYEDIPAPKGLPVIGTLWDLVSKGAMQNLHQYCTERHRQLGPIYRETLGVVEGVFVADGNLFQQIYQNEGKYPRHLVPEPWIIYNEISGNKRGLFFMDGPEWGERRKSLNNVFLRSSSMSKNTEAFNAIVSDVLQRWKSFRKDGELLQLEKELYKWTVESLGAMIFGRRLGCLDESGYPDIHKFVNCVQQIFVESANMTMIPPKLAYKLKLPVWKRFEKAVTTGLNIAQSYVEDTVQEMIARAERGEEVDGTLAQLLFQDNIGKEEVVRIVTDLIVAAADTTSHATQWTLYLLAKNPEWQEKIFEEIYQVAPGKQLITADRLTSLPLIKAVVKESLRLYPVAPFLTRILSEDLTLGGFHIPAGKLVLMSLYTTGRDPTYFADPNEFNPSRWLRKDNSREVIGTHACLPFGLGARSCVGRRIAEVQMHLLLARTLQAFKLDCLNENEVNIKLRMITTPSENIRLRLTDRSTFV